jgi:hypothetical protein
VGNDVAPLLSAAARLDPLRDATPDRAFADDLEQRLMARMSQAPRPLAAQTAQTAPTQATQAPQRPRVFRPSPRAAWAAMAAALLLTIGLGALSAKAAPGAPLYVVRQLAQTLASQAMSAPTADPFAALAQAKADLTAYNKAIANANQPAALAALSKLRTDDGHAAQRIGAMTDTTARQTAQTQLADFRLGAETDLRASLTALNWQGRAQVTGELHAWGNSDLVVTQARVLPDTASGQSKQTTPNGTTLLIEVRGAGFAQGAQLLVNGQPTGTIITLTPTQLTARVAATAITVGESGDGGDVTIGVANPDGTVALSTHAQRDDHGSPNASETPNPGNHSNDHNGSANGTPEPGSNEDATATPSATKTASPSPTPGG